MNLKSDPPSKDPPSSFLRKKILLVEDEALIALAEASLLRKHGYEVVTASNGTSAIEMAEKDPSLDLVLMDIDLGKGIDGTEAARRILEKRDLPVLFLSGHSEPDVVDRTYRIGSYGYILKNAGDTVLLASLRMAFKLSETHKKQVETERRLRALQKSYDSIIRRAPVSVLIVQDEKYVFSNEYGASLLGFRSPEELIGVTVKDTIDPAYLESIENRIKTVLTGTANLPARVKVRRKDGSFLWVESVSIPVEYQERPAALVIGRDISSTVTVEEQLQKTSLLYSSRSDLLEYSFSQDLPEILQRSIDIVCFLTGSTIGFFHLLETDGKGNQTVNLHAWSTTTIEKFCTAKGFTTHYPIEQAGLWADCARIKKPVIHNHYATLETRKGYPAGHPQLVRELTVPVIRNNRCVAVLGVGNKSAPYNQEDLEIASRFSDLAWDIVERKRSVLSLQRSEERQRSLLKELRHRMRNTFHQIVSLTSLQANQEKKVHAQAALRDMQNRVLVLAGLYDTLQEQESGTISLDTLVQRVCTSLSEAFAFCTEQKLTFHADSISADAKSASAFGLILNELITNSYKHAFPAGRKGTIHVSLVKDEGQAILTVEDDGVGFDPAQGETSKEHLGFELIQTLSNQIGAKFEIHSKVGTRVEVTVPLKAL